MTTQLAKQEEMNVIESVVIGGDLSKLSREQRVNYYRAVCESLGLNPLTKPFDYIKGNDRWRRTTKASGGSISMVSYLLHEVYHR